MPTSDAGRRPGPSSTATGTRATCRSWACARHAAWLGSSVFDGARAFEGVAPDLDLHCARVNASAQTFFLEPMVPIETWIGPRRAKGCKPVRPRTPSSTSGRCTGRAGRGSWRDRGRIRRRRAGASRSTSRRCRSRPGSRITLSPFRRPTLECVPVDAKAGCLYPNNARALIEAHARGFDNCLHVRHAGQCRRARHRQHLHGQGRRRVHAGAERHASSPASPASASSGCCATPASTVVEATLRYPISRPPTRSSRPATTPRWRRSSRIDDRALQPGPLYRKARELYWEFAHGGS